MTYEMTPEQEVVTRDSLLHSLYRPDNRLEYLMLREQLIITMHMDDGSKREFRIHTDVVMGKAVDAGLAEGSFGSYRLTEKGEGIALMMEFEYDFGNNYAVVE